MKFYERSLQALLSSAPRSFADRSRVLARLASLPQIGELARELRFHIFCYALHYSLSVVKVVCLDDMFKISLFKF